MTTDPYAAVPWNEDPRNPRRGPIIEPVPTGSIAAIMRWVGDDLERADRALDAEIDGQNRGTLIAKLEALLDDVEIEVDE
jgi:hypothetical protein